MASEVMVGFVTDIEGDEGVIRAEVVEEFISFVVDSTFQGSIGIPSEVDKSVGVSFTKVINSSLEEC